MTKLTSLLRPLWLLILQGLTGLFGVIQWQKPVWVMAIRNALGKAWQFTKSKPLMAGSGVLAILLLSTAGWFGYHWWQNRPQPVMIDFEIETPTRTEIENKSKPNPLVITFSASVAPLEQVDQDVKTGITTSPAIAGVWHWLDDRKLEFRPDADWPIAQDFQVKFAKSLVAPQIDLARWDFNFTAPVFTANIEKSEFYRDPIDPALKKAVINLRFSHPVDSASLEKHINLTLQNKAEGEKKTETLKFSVVYDKLKLNAFVHSQALAVPRYDQQVLFTLEDGVKPEQANVETTEPLNASIDVPGLYTTLAINNIQLTVTTNNQTQLQDQILVLNSTVPVHEQDMAKALEVWLLPKDRPVPEGAEPEPENDQPYNWSASEVTPDVLKLSTPIKLQAIPAEHEYTDIHSFRIQADVGRFVFVKVAKGVKAFGGYIAPEPVYQTLIVPAFQKELHIMGEGSLLTLSGEKKIALMARDLRGVKIELGRVLPEQLQHLISQTQGDFAHPEFSGDFKADNLSEHFETKLPLPALANGKPHYQPVDLSHYMTDAQGNSKRGMFLLSLSGYDPNKKDGEDDSENTQVEDKRLVLITDLGIIAKTEHDGSQVVFVQSIQTGQPQVDAEVSVIGKNGLVLFSGKTDAQGKVRFSKLSDLKRDREPELYLAKHQGDMSFLPLGREDRKLDLSRFPIDGAENALDPNQLSAYLFSDRGIYRPGDTINIGIIVKTETWSQPLLGLPLVAEILDPRGLAVKRTNINLSAGGFNELSHQTLESSPTGNYSVNLYTVKDGRNDQFLGNTRVKVEEFQPDRIKTVVKFSKPVSDGWVHPGDLQALVNVQNLYGAPAENRRVEGSLTLKPALPAFKRFPDYQFHDPHYAKEGYDETLSPVQTDSNGDAKFALDLDKYTQATYQLHFLARAFEAEGGRSVAAEADTLVSDMPYLLGYKADGALDFVAKDAKRDVHILAIDPQLNPSPAENLSIELIERKVLSVLTRKEDGTYRYESRPKEISLHKEALVIGKTGYNLVLDSSNPGDYAYVVRNADGLVLSKIDYSVAGVGNVSRSLDRNAELQLTLDKTDYASGEKIAVNIRAPYTGAGLITIERDKVYASQWFKADSQASVQTIEVPKDLVGNGYVTVQYIRDPGSDEIFMSPLSYGVAAFKVSLAEHTQALSLDAPELIKPGQKLTMTVHSPEPTRVVVFAVDEGILQVARYQNPDPLGYFFKKKQLAVDTTQILDLILPEFNKLMQAAAPGGDGSEEAAASFLNPFKRKHDLPAVYWSGIVDLSGDKEFIYQVPETFNGTLRVMAVAVNDGKIASLSKKTQVRGDLIVTPNAPFMVAPGDEFTVSVAVANNVKGSGAQAPVQISLATPAQLAVQDAAQKTVSIAEGHEGSATFKIKALTGKQAILGNATLNFVANVGKQSTAMHSELSIRPPVPKVASLRFGSFKTSQEVSIDRLLYPEYRRVNAGVSPLPLVAAPGLTSYLKNYSYSCTEQLISKAFPLLVLSQHPELSEEPKAANSEAHFTRLISVLRTRQNAEGGFGLWTASPKADEFASVYAVHWMLEAKVAGHGIPEDMLQKSMGYLQTLAASPANELDNIRVRAYAAYLLTRQGIVTTTTLSSLRDALTANFQEKDWRKDLVAGYLAASYQLLKQEQLANNLLKTLVERLGVTDGQYQYQNYYDPLIHDAQLLYLLAMDFPERFKALPPTVFQASAKALQEQHYNTLSSAYLLLAYSTFLNTVPADVAKQLSITALDQAGQKQALTLPESLAPRASFPDTTKKLVFAGPNDIPLYYAVSESGFDQLAPTTAFNNGVEIIRTYLDAQGKAVDHVGLGEEITVQIRVRAIDRDYISSLAIQDLLPGGFEAVIQTLSAEGSDEEDEEAPAWQDRLSTGGNWAADYADVREDRVVLYGSINNELAEYQYKIKATAAGTFLAPPVFAEAMYEPTVQGHSAAGSLVVGDK